MIDNLCFMNKHRVNMMPDSGSNFRGSQDYFNPAIYGIYVKNYINLYNTVTFYRIDTYKEH